MSLIFDDIQKYVLSTEATADDIGARLFERYPNAQLVLSEVRSIFHALMPHFQDNGLIVADVPLSQYEQNLLVHEIIRKLSYCLYQRLTCYVAGLDIDLITTLSSTAYESKSPEGETIAILPSLEWLKKDPVAMFNPLDSVALGQTQIRALRKQLNICGKGALAIYKDYYTGVYKTAGLISRDAALKLPRFHFQKHAEWIFAVNDTVGNDGSCLRKKDGSCQHEKGGFCLRKNDGRCLREEDGSCQRQKDGLCLREKDDSRLRYCNGSLMLPLLNLQDVYRTKLDKVSDNEDEKNKLAHIINALNKCKHGAILVIAEDNILASELERLPPKKRGTRLDLPVPLISDTDSSASHDDAEPTIPLKQNNESSLILQQLAAVDGAIFVDSNGRCHAFGVILDGTVQSDGNNARGSRYNSTKTYIEWIRRVEYADKNPTILGVVKSEDGMIDLFA